MDPFSTTASAIGITRFAMTSIVLLRTLINNLSEAQDVLEDVAANLANIERPLAALEEFHISDEATLSAAKQDLRKAGVPKAVNECGDACSSFSKNLTKWTKHCSATKLSLRDRLSVGVWNRERIHTLRTQVQSCEATVYFAVTSAQLMVQLRSKKTSEANCEDVRKQLQTLETKIQDHFDLTWRQQVEAEKRRQALQEEPEDEEDGGAQRTLAIKEVEEQSRLLEADRVSCGVMFSQVRSKWSGQDIGDVVTSDNSQALVAKDKNGKTVLHSAASSWWKNEAVVRVLVERGADVFAKDNDGETVLHWAAREGNEAIVQLLLEAGANVYAKDNDGETVLHWAAREGNEAIVQLLLEAGADVSAKDNDGETVLHWAAREGNEAVLQLLVERGADVNATDKYGETVLHSATLSSRTSKAVMHSLTNSNTGANVESSNQTSGVLAQALERRDFSAVRQLLEDEFDNVAQDEYEWLHELIDVGNSRSDIAELLLEEANDAPWIYSDPQDQLIQGLELQNPAITPQDPLDVAFLSSPWMSKRHDVRIMIQQLCGLGGIAPTSRSLHDWNGEVVFEDNYSISHITYAISSQDIGVTHVSKVVPRLRRVLENFCKAVAVLQSNTLCLDYFTIARSCSASTFSKPGNIEIKRIDVALAVALSTELDRLPSSISSDILDLTKPLDIAVEIMHVLLPPDNTLFTKVRTTEESLHVCCLAAQFLCVGLVSFCQGHIGPIESVHTNHAQERSVLLGNCNLNEKVWQLHPYIAVRLSNLTCLGQMTEGPLITFTMSEEWLRGSTETHNVIPKALLDKKVTKTSLLGHDDLFARECENHVKATPRDILCTWGPGRLVSSEHNESLLRAIHIGGGVIYPKDEVGSGFHWEAGSGPSELLQASFHYESEITVGGWVKENQNPCLFPWRRWKASCPLAYLAAEPKRWDPNQRQLGLQAGPDHASLQAIQVWTLVPATLLKQCQLRKDHFDITEFLGCYMGVQVSCCTGVARRVSLQDLLKDLMPKFCFTYMSDKRWNDWNAEYNIMTGLRSTDIRNWLFELQDRSVEAFNALLEHIRCILKILEPTGLSRGRTHIHIAWPTEGDFLRGIKVCCKDKYLWAQALIDSEEGVTFAYMTATCLLCEGSSCQQLEQRWNMTPKCLETAITRYRKELEQESQQQPVRLLDGQSYHMWNEKRYIRLKVNTVGSMYCLIASESIIPGYMGLRHFRSKRYRAEYLIRERYHPDDVAIDVLMLDK